ncbi:MAG TPA: hypothetical protein DC042_12675 [Bacteroidales bacterium]|nr:hypothetical protein [Bacteroidales bacterium]
MKRLMDKAKDTGTKSGIEPVVGKIWQRDYYENIIRSEESYHKIATYIHTNPQNWTQDKFYQIFE